MDTERQRDERSSSRPSVPLFLLALQVFFRMNYQLTQQYSLLCSTDRIMTSFVYIRVDLCLVSANFYQKEFVQVRLLP